MIGKISQLIQFVWMFESHRQQRLAWDDAAKARIARERSEAQSQRQLVAMREANPSGALGWSQLNDPENLRESGLL